MTSRTVIRAFSILFLACANLAASCTDHKFIPIFDGETLDGWDFDPTYWRVENGCMVGEITLDTIVRRNTFIIWTGGEPADFELTVEYRISHDGNSGVSYRNARLTDARWSLTGYQADIDGAGGPPRKRRRHTGQAYDERGRTFLALRGQVVRLTEDSEPQVVGSVGGLDELTAQIREEDWNAYHIIARGPVMTHILNGQVMAVVVDDDVTNRRLSGLIGFQVHTGPPMKVEFRNIELKSLKRTP